MPPPQARAILKAMELELVSAQPGVVTHSGPAAEFSRLRAEMAAGFSKMRARMVEIRGEVGAIRGEAEGMGARPWGKTAVRVPACTPSQTAVRLGVVCVLLARFVR